MTVHDLKYKLSQNLYSILQDLCMHLLNLVHWWILETLVRLPQIYPNSID